MCTYMNQVWVEVMVKVQLHPVLHIFPTLPDDVFNTVIKVIILFGTLALFRLCFFRRSEADSVSWEEGPRLELKGTETETQAEPVVGSC